ncbi:MAG: hypothetical protein NC930_06770 [Candidatus Omnitrophica bacterium]|nr:hypothetical protein [Candidatus Omnitrophota bacterium]
MKVQRVGSIRYWIFLSWEKTGKSHSGADNSMSSKGFLLVEVFIAVLTLSIVIVAWMNTMCQVLALCKRSDQIMKALLQTENIFFNIRTGNRPDLLAFGGKEISEEGWIFDVQGKSVHPSYQTIKICVVADRDREILSMDAWIPKRTVT